LAWTTNIGQDYHHCKGSKFSVDYTGVHGGMVVKKGMRLKKGLCPHRVNGTIPYFTKALSCKAEATGCHMWCAPVFQSHHDTLDWSAFDSRCKGWDRSFNSNDTECSKMGKVFSWARVDVPSSKNALALSFAISEGCTSWCSPLWVTVYDPKNWAKSFRWCFNRKDDWGVCDNSTSVALSSWHDEKFKFSYFMEKHGYIPEHLTLELAVYSEFESPEIMINSMKLIHVAEKKKTAVKDGEPKLLAVQCGSEPSCGSDHQCCRLGDSEVDAKCCPKDWSCCEDSCCPSYFVCNITEGGHRCSPPKDEVIAMPELCSL